MAGLQRSSLTFRRSGSSGMVWDERLMSDEHSQWTSGEPEFRELRHSLSVGSAGPQQRRRNGSAERGGGQAFRTRRVAPATDPPSPKVPGCIFCGIFRRAAPSRPFKGRRYH